jgi:hypothetical protein
VLNGARGFSTVKRPGVFTPPLEGTISNAIAAIVSSPCARIFPADGRCGLPSDVPIFPLAISNLCHMAGNVQQSASRFAASSIGSPRAQLDLPCPAGLKVKY